MAVSESVLNAVNLFSSTSVFNANKGSVGATDLNFIKQTTAELATEGGGIIAQSLGTNGYVKFANGLILQWGFQTTNRTFPISFNTQCLFVTCLYQSNGSESGAAWFASYVLSKTTTNYSCGGTNKYVHNYIAIGK